MLNLLVDKASVNKFTRFEMPCLIECRLRRLVTNALSTCQLVTCQLQLELAKVELVLQISGKRNEPPRIRACKNVHFASQRAKSMQTAVRTAYSDLTNSSHACGEDSGNENLTLRRRRILVTAVGVRWRKAAIDLMEKSAHISRLTRSSWRLTRTGPVVSLRRKPSSNWSASVSNCCQSSSVTGAAVVSFLRKSRQASEAEKRCFIRRRRCSSSSRQRKVCASSCFSSVSCRQRLSLSVS